MNAVKKTNYHKTKIACYMGFITQAIAANFAPLLFLKFHSDYHISLGNIALISTFFFFTQLLVDLFGEEIGAPSRSAIGAVALPGNTPVEIEGIVQMED